jgi:nifR3 family TIM-barrel protein
MSALETFRALMASRPVLLAPMEDVSDAVFRRFCRGFGADGCFTEFVNVESLLKGCSRAERKLHLTEEDRPTAIQIYGADPGRLMEAARIAEAERPAFIDVNCGCWVPKIARRGAGAGWLKDPRAMVEMAQKLAGAVSLPLTVKTRIGIGVEEEMPIVDLARRLEDAGVAALTIHCRTAKMGYTGQADWEWAARAQAVVKMPVIVNGDIRTADDVERALKETGCAGVMIGRGAIAHPWIFREVHQHRAGLPVTPPTPAERLRFLRAHLIENVRVRGEGSGVTYSRRYLAGYLTDVPGGAELRMRMNGSALSEEWLRWISEKEAQLAGTEGFARAG